MADTISCEGIFESRKEELLKLIEPAGGQWGIFIEDLDGKGALKLNPETEFTAASVIKVPIMMAAYKEARRGLVRLDDKIVLGKDDKVGGSGVLQELHTGLEISLQDAINLMIVVSDNTATNLVIDAVGKETVNLYMVEKGLKGSRLENHLMKPRPRGPWNKITAGDMAILFKGLAQRNIDNPGDCDAMLEILKRQQYNEKLPRDLPREAICAHKTGEVNGVTHDAGIIESPKTRFIIVCLSQNLENTRTGIKIIGDVAKWAYDILAKS